MFQVATKENNNGLSNQMPWKVIAQWKEMIQACPRQPFSDSKRMIQCTVCGRLNENGVKRETNVNFMILYKEIKIGQYIKLLNWKDHIVTIKKQ